MNTLMTKMQNEYGFSDFQIKLIKYSISVITYDLSKLIIFFFYFYITGKIIHFLFAIVPLFLLRTLNGGIHFQKYWQCFFVSFAYLSMSINILPSIFILPSLYIYVILIICSVINYLIGPNTLVKKTPPTKAFIKKVRLETFQIILIIAILLFIFSANKYLIISFWTVVLHTFQLAISKIIKEVNSNEKLA